MLRFFDQVQFEIVSEEELVTLRRDFKANIYHPKKITEEFSLKDYNKFLHSVNADVQLFQRKQELGALWGKQRAEELDKEYRIGTNPHTQIDLASQRMIPL